MCGVALPKEQGGLGLWHVGDGVDRGESGGSGGGRYYWQLFMINPIFAGSVGFEIRQRMDAVRNTAPAHSGKLNCCMALTEANAGSNTLELQTTARAEGDGWRLNGSKIWITCVPNAQKMLVVARTQKKEECKRRTDGLSLFMIDATREGLSHQEIDKLGTRTLALELRVFRQCAGVPGGTRRHAASGWPELLEVLNTERIVTTAALVGAGELAIRLAVDYAEQRSVFKGATISRYQGIQFPLAQCHAEIEAARLMNYRAATLCDDHQPYGSEANIAKLLAAQTVARATERSMQTMGRHGLLQGVPCGEALARCAACSASHPSRRR